MTCLLPGHRWDYACCGGVYDRHGECVYVCKRECGSDQLRHAWLLGYGHCGELRHDLHELRADGLAE